MKKPNIESKFEIRFGKKEDSDTILFFIKKLAEYEKLAHEVVATPELIKNHLFSKNSSAEVVLGHYNNEPVGFALFYKSFSTFLGRPGMHLEDLFILPEWRGHGFGKKLLSYLANIAVKRNYGRYEWAVLDWNKPSIDFYKSQGAVPMSEWTTFRVSGTSLQSLADQFNKSN